MCIAAIIFAPVSLEYLQEMDNDNPHGGGVAFAKPGKGVRFIKGLNAKQIFRLQEDKVVTYPYMLHFRWATMGDKVAALCHPFPIGPRALLGETKGYADKVLIHNGTWAGYNRLIPVNSEVPDSLLKCQSDTALAAWLIADRPEILKEVMWATATGWIDAAGNLEVETTGTWTDYEGNWYSNLSWLPAKAWWTNTHRRSEIDYARTALVNAQKAFNRKRAAQPGYNDPDWEEKWLAWYTGQYATDDDETPTKEALGFADEDDTVVLTDEELKEESMLASNQFNSWEEYVKARYGDEVAEAISELDAQDAEDEITLATLDIVSEDPETVNRFLAKQMVG
jgi:hypothetical protein